MRGFLDPEVCERVVGVADVGTQGFLADAHDAAVAEWFLMEGAVAATQLVRPGVMARLHKPTSEPDRCGVRLRRLPGGRPASATPVVISNQVRITLDNERRSLDGRPLHAAVVALS